MMRMYARSLEDVRSWPSDPDASRGLRTYLESLPADPSGERTSESLLNGWGLDFSGADLSGLDLLGAELSEAKVDHVRFVGTDLHTAWIADASARGADFSQSDIRKLQGRGCDARAAKFREANLEKADLDGADLSGADLSGANLQRSFLAGADLRGADLRTCRLNGSSFAKAKVAWCLVEGCRGVIRGPIDVGVETTELLSGEDLNTRFSERGAPEVKAVIPARS
ncbi:pentapeptide repeat-containing protein [Nocardia cyriacigeorgica]|uniref:Pentapeptide repeat-containing protein n=1 Tax=Nocardia cyriacigeorgica TaxID=135487 RepID=A0A5R8P124_9NOCA|nr:pentapeptide repeat-containing protein [Nocardia cyriacigeorgica]